MTEKALYKKLAKYYDKIYSSKDYKKEVEFIEKMIKKLKKKNPKVLDVACGTGNHSLLLKKKGYSVLGADLSPHMLKIARKKVKGMMFVKADMQKLDLKKKFDVIICMFSAINYNRNYKDLERTLKGFYNHLRNGGILIFDLGFSPYKKEVSRRIDTVEEKNLLIARFSQVDKVKETEIDAKFVIFKKEGKKIDFWIDKHKLGTFKINRVKNLMKKIGFKTRIYNEFSFKEYYKKSNKPVFVGVKK